MLVVARERLKPMNPPRVRWKAGAPFAWWIADRGGGFIGCTENRYAATNAGNVTNSAGIRGPAIHMDGTAGTYVSFGNRTFLKGMTAASLSVWFKTTATTEKNLWGETWNQYQGLLVGSSGAGKVRWGTFTNAVSTLNSTATYNDGSWHHAVGTYDAATTNAILYVDGVQVATGFGGSAAFSDAGGYSCLGAELKNDGSTNAVNFVGDIDDARIYSYALTPAQVLVDYLDPWWRLRKRRPWWATFKITTRRPLPMLFGRNNDYLYLPEL